MDIKDNLDPGSTEPKAAEPEKKKSAAIIQLLDGELTVEKQADGSLKFTGTKERMCWVESILQNARGEKRPHTGVPYTIDSSGREIVVTTRLHIMQAASALQKHLDDDDVIKLGGLVLYGTPQTRESAGTGFGLWPNNFNNPIL